MDSEDISADECVMEDGYIEDNYYDEGDCYKEDDDNSDDFFYGEEEIEEGTSIDSEFSGQDESDFAYSTSYDGDSSQCSGYGESSY